MVSGWKNSFFQKCSNNSQLKQKKTQGFNKVKTFVCWNEVQWKSLPSSLFKTTKNVLQSTSKSFFSARSVMHLGDDRWKSILNYGPHLVSNKVHKENEKGASTAYFEFPSKFWKDNLPPFVRRSKALCNRPTVNCWCGPPDSGRRRLLYKLMGKFGCYFKQKLSYLKSVKYRRDTLGI